MKPPHLKSYSELSLLSNIQHIQELEKALLFAWYVAPTYNFNLSPVRITGNYIPWSSSNWLLSLANGRHWWETGRRMREQPKTATPPPPTLMSQIAPVAPQWPQVLSGSTHYGLAPAGHSSALVLWCGLLLLSLQSQGYRSSCCNWFLGYCIISYLASEQHHHSCNQFPTFNFFCWKV